MSIMHQVYQTPQASHPIATHVPLPSHETPFGTRPIPRYAQAHSMIPPPIYSLG
jgi:hypothetical protein